MDIYRIRDSEGKSPADKKGLTKSEANNECATLPQMGSLEKYNMCKDSSWKAEEINVIFST